jgi:hypothetical protein
MFLGFHQKLGKPVSELVSLETFLPETAPLQMGPENRFEGAQSKLRQL